MKVSLLNFLLLLSFLISSFHTEECFYSKNSYIKYQRNNETLSFEFLAAGRTGYKGFGFSKKDQSNLDDLLFIATSTKVSQIYETNTTQKKDFQPKRIDSFFLLMDDIISFKLQIPYSNMIQYNQLFFIESESSTNYDPQKNKKQIHEFNITNYRKNKQSNIKFPKNRWFM